MTKTEIKPPPAVVAAKRAIIQIGTGGRGFIVGAAKDRRYIITAAHCLPHFPEPHLANSANELSYPDILSALGKPERKVWAALVEFNSASDFAVLGAPDDQALWEECEQYEAFTEHATMRIAESPPLQPPDFDLMSEADFRAWKPLGREAPAWMLSLDGQWLRCMVQNSGRFLTVTQGGQYIKSGMSGSPIITDDGAAIGLVSTSGSYHWNVNPSLSDCLPAWLLRELDVVRRDAWRSTAAGAGGDGPVADHA